MPPNPLAPAQEQPVTQARRLGTDSTSDLTTINYLHIRVFFHLVSSAGRSHEQGSSSLDLPLP